MPIGHSRKARADAFVIEDEAQTRDEVTHSLETLGLGVAAFDNASDALAQIDAGAPKIIFLDVALNQSDAVDVIKGLGERKYDGVVQLFSGHPRLLDAIQRIALRYRLAVRPPIPKPLTDEAIAGIVMELGIAGRPVVAH
jgi:DNA-binding NtrC family response regulator